MLSAEDRQYLIALLDQRKEHIQKLENAIRAMGDHAFINDGLINEGVLKSKQLSEELEQIRRIAGVLGGEST